VAYRSHKTKKAEALEAAKPPPPEEEEPEDQKLGDALDIDEISVELAPNIVPNVMDEDFGFDQRVQKIRKFITKELGFILPAIRLTDNALLPDDTYKIKIQGTEIAMQVLKSSQVLVLIDPEEHPHIPGENTKEPVFQAPARWIDKAYEDEMMMLGMTVIAPIEVLATHLLEVIQDNFTKILSRRTLRQTLDTFKTVSDPDRAESNKKILDEFIPEKVPLELLQGVCRLLLEDCAQSNKLSIRLEITG